MHIRLFHNVVCCNTVLKKYIFQFLTLFVQNMVETMNLYISVEEIRDVE